MGAVDTVVRVPQRAAGDAPPPPTAPRGPAAAPARVRWAELSVVVALLVPSALSFVPSAGVADVGFAVGAASTALRDGGLVALVAFLVWRGGEPLAALGGRARRPLVEVGIGILAFPLVFELVRWSERGLRLLGVPGPAQRVTFLRPAMAPSQLVVATLLVAVVAVAEETVFRGYLMLRVGQVTGSVLATVVGPAVVFALGHGYEGLAGALAIGAFGVVMGLLYRWRGSLIAPIVVHFLQDATVLVVLTALQR